MPNIYSHNVVEKIVDYEKDSKQARQRILDVALQLIQEGANIISITEAVFPAVLHKENVTASVMSITVYYSKDT